jgi:hypothetical protein
VGAAVFYFKNYEQSLPSAVTAALGIKAAMLRRFAAFPPGRPPC